MNGGELTKGLGMTTQALGVNPSSEDDEEGEGRGGEPSFTFEQCATVAELVCASDDAFIVRRHR